jgi:hypothetical protein
MTDEARRGIITTPPWMMSAISVVDAWDMVARDCGTFFSFLPHVTPMQPAAWRRFEVSVALAAIGNHARASDCVTGASAWV